MHKTFSGLCFFLTILCAFAFVAYTGAQNPQHPQPQSNRYAAPSPASQAEQQNFPPQLLDELAAIKSAALTDDYAYRQGEHLTENIGARPTGSAQANAAVAYVAGELRQLGLDVHLQEAKKAPSGSGAGTPPLI